MMRRSSKAGMRENVPLALYTTLGIGGPARYFVEAGHESEIVRALEFGTERNLPLFLLGGGSNVLVSDEGFPGLVIRIALLGVRERGGGLAGAAAGEDWDSFVEWCVKQDLAGIECLSGIPGTVGGTPIQNVGAYGQEVSDVIESVRVLDRRTGQALEHGKPDCRFSYRTSIYNSGERGRYVILGVTFRLRPGDAPRLTYPDLRHAFEGRGLNPSLADVRGAVLRIRERKGMVLLPRDVNAKSAGSFFKNPTVPEAAAQSAEEAARHNGFMREGEAMPRYPAAGGSVKLSAAWLIEHAGFAKGLRRGRVGLSTRHALAIVNAGGATAREVLALMREIQEAVWNLYRVELIPEPVLVGFEEPLSGGIY
jgi:UDP-N-acetylmuramate dehydrogenase